MSTTDLVATLTINVDDDPINQTTKNAEDRLLSAQQTF